jgi:hypothetical protein
MIDSVSGSSAVNQVYQQQQQQKVPANNTKQVQKTAKADSVVLSKQAQAAIKSSHKGGSR